MLPRSCNIFRAPDTANRIHLFGVLDIAAAKVGVVATQRHQHLMKREFVAAQRVRIDLDRVFLRLALPRS